MLVPMAAQGADKIAPRVLVIATFETGKDKGDVPGELQAWAEREHLDREIKVPGIDHPVLTNGMGLYAMISGVTARSAVQIMALAMDQRFDLRHTYFLVSAIGGADPAHVSLGSAVWIKQVVDGDPIFEIDAREIPKTWPYGTVAMGETEPGKVPANVDAAPAAGVSEDGAGGVGRMVYTLNPPLVEWAFQLTKNVVLQDTPRLAAVRTTFDKYPAAAQKPGVLEGDSLATNRFWHGTAMNHWAEDWVRLYTKGAGSLMISDCEDQGVELAMQELDRLGRLDAKRLLILRSASNFTVPPPGMNPEKSLFDGLADSPGYLSALDANYRVGKVVVDALLGNWAEYKTTIPGGGRDAETSTLPVHR